MDDRISNRARGVFDDRGQVWTLAFMVDAGVRSRLGIEWLWLDSQRPVALQSGTSIDSGGSMLSLEWRLRFF